MDKPVTPNPSGATPDFVMGQITQNLQDMKEELGHVRSAILHFSSNYVQQAEFDKLQTEFTTLVSDLRTVEKDAHGRKMVDRMIVAAVGALSGAGGMVLPFLAMTGGAS